jgi:hypothetical protein
MDLIVIAEVLQQNLLAYGTGLRGSYNSTISKGCAFVHLKSHVALITPAS